MGQSKACFCLPVELQERVWPPQELHGQQKNNNNQCRLSSLLIIMLKLYFIKLFISYLFVQPASRHLKFGHSGVCDFFSIDLIVTYNNNININNISKTLFCLNLLPCKFFSDERQETQVSLDGYILSAFQQWNIL